MEHLSPSDYTIQTRKHCKKKHADVQAYPVDEDTIAMSNAPNNALIGEFIHQGCKQDMSKMHIIAKTTS
jgi:hypothetical protein